MVKWSSAVVVALLAVNCVAAVTTDSAEPLNKPADNDDYLVKQVIWKKCHRKLTPACLKLSLVRTVEMMSKDSSFFLAPGVFFSSNFSDSSSMPQELARGLSQEHAHLDDLVSFTVSRFIRSITLNVNLVDFFSGGNETVQNSMVDAFSGRGKGHGLGGYGGIALVMGGSLASMMLAALAALAGKALMTSMLALMMSALAAMKGGGGGGGGEHKTYEVITKPIVSHVNTHSSEVQHEHGGHHHYGRSLDQGIMADVLEAEPYAVYALERQRLMRSANIEDQRVPREEEQISSNLKAIGEELISDSSKVQNAESSRNKRSLSNANIASSKKRINDINHNFFGHSSRNKRNVDKVSDQEKSSSKIQNTYSEFSEEDKFTVNSKKEQGRSESQEDVSQRNKRGIEGMIERTGLNTEEKFYDLHQQERHENVLRTNPAAVNENPKIKRYDSKIYFPDNLQEHQRHKRNVNSYVRNKVVPAEGSLNYYNPPFKYIPNNSNARIKRNNEGSRLSDSRIHHIYQSPYEYASKNRLLTKQFSIDNRRYKRFAEERLTMPIALVE